MKTIMLLLLIGYYLSASGCTDDGSACVDCECYSSQTPVWKVTDQPGYVWYHVESKNYVMELYNTVIPGDATNNAVICNLSEDFQDKEREIEVVFSGTLHGSYTENIIPSSRKIAVNGHATSVLILDNIELSPNKE